MCILADLGYFVISVGSNGFCVISYGSIGLTLYFFVCLLYSKDAPPSGEFQEIEGESEERRKARFNHHMSTRERMVFY